MEWMNNLLFGNSIAHTVLIYSIAIAAGVALGKVKIFGISLGITFVLFTGILLGHLGLEVNHEVLEFVREFGLILFVFTIGLQVGPGFFASFKKGGLVLNLWTIVIVSLNVLVTIGIILIAKIPAPMAVGIMSGAVTNTPGLGAAQQALNQIVEASPGMVMPNIGLGYAVAYPFGVLGIITTLILLRKIFNLNLKEENAKYSDPQRASEGVLLHYNVMVTNPAIFGKTVRDVYKLIGKDAIVSRILRKGEIQIARSESVILENDIILIIAPRNELAEIAKMIGKESEVDIKSEKSDLTTKQILVTNKRVLGKKLGDLRIGKVYGVKITRIYRSDMEFLALPELYLQMGDKINVVGEEEAIENASKLLGNSTKRLREPNLIPIFVGILLGVILGSIPFAFPGVPVPVKLGMAGGPLIVAILLSRYGYKIKLISYTTPSANFLLREVGIVLFLASVGLKAGGQFVETLMSGDGFIWMGYGILITLIPILIVGCLAKIFSKRNYFELCGLLAGSCTDPPALAYANSIASNNAPGLAYATVYPMAMFLRILAAQLLILFFV
jgi:putative transport protein